MAIISFWGNDEKETGQTLSVVAIGTEMAIDHNKKILIISTGYKDKTMEDCFWEKRNLNIVGTEQPQGGIANGFEGLVKIIQSNRTSSNIIRDYAKVVFRDRLDILLAPSTNDPKIYNNLTTFYKDLLKYANQEYEIVLVDVDKRMNGEDKSEILKASDAVMVTCKQSQDGFEMIRNLKEKSTNYKKRNIMYLLGKYDFNSKYNTKNLTRILKETREVSAVPYNVSYYESTMEGKVADFFLNNRSLTDNADVNARFIQECKRCCENIIAKIEELKMKM